MVGCNYLPLVGKYHTELAFQTLNKPKRTLYMWSCLHQSKILPKLLVFWCLLLDYFHLISKEFAVIVNPL